MKKIFCFIIFILMVSSVWANEYKSSTIIVRTTVSTISLSEAMSGSDGTVSLYKLYGGFDSESGSDLDYIEANDISEGDITVYFKIMQLAKTRTDESIELSVSADRLVNSNSSLILTQSPDALVETPSPVISEVSCNNMNSFQVSSVRKNENEVLFTIRYIGFKPVENVNLVYFRTTWGRMAGLAPGLYTSKITLSYIVK